MGTSLCVPPARTWFLSVLQRLCSLGSQGCWLWVRGWACVVSNCWDVASWVECIAIHTTGCKISVGRLELSKFATVRTRFQSDPSWKRWCALCFTLLIAMQSYVWIYSITLWLYASWFWIDGKKSSHLCWAIVAFLFWLCWAMYLMYVGIVLIYHLWSVDTFPDISYGVCWRKRTCLFVTFIFRAAWYISRSNLSCVWFIDDWYPKAINIVSFCRPLSLYVVALLRSLNILATTGSASWKAWTTSTSIWMKEYRFLDSTAAVKSTVERS